MYFYLILIAVICLLGALLCWKNRSRAKDTVFIVAAFVIIAGISAARYDVGIDYSLIYGPIHEKVINDQHLSLSQMREGYGTDFSPTSYARLEPGFLILMRTIAVFSPNYHMFFVVTSVLIIGLIFFFFWKYSPNVFVSVFVFLAMSHFYCTLDFIRQSLSAAIALFAIPLFQKRTIKSAVGYILIVLLAASMHQSALILIPLYVVNLIPINKYVLAAYSAVTVAVYFNITRIIDFVTQYWYPHYSKNAAMAFTFSFHFTIAVVIELIVLFLGTGLLKELHPRNTVYVNYAFYTAVFVLMGTRHAILDRMGIVFAMAAPVSIAMLTHQLGARLPEIRFSSPRGWLNKKVVSFAIMLVLLFGGGMYMHQYSLETDSHGVAPYKAIFSQPFYSGYVESLKHRGNTSG